MLKKIALLPACRACFCPICATGSSKLRSSEATVRPRSSQFKNYCRNDGIEQPQWDMDWSVSWLRPGRLLRRLPRKGSNSRKAGPHWSRKTKKINPAKEFLEIRYSWLLFKFFLGVWSLDETIFLLIYTSQVLYITYHIHCQFLVGVVVGGKGFFLVILTPWWALTLCCNWINFTGNLETRNVFAGSDLGPVSRKARELFGPEVRQILKFKLVQ